LPDDPRITLNIQLQRQANDFLELLGETPQFEWLAHFTESDAKRLWAKLDVLLFPVGWQGREAQAQTNATEELKVW
jgi:hypothetical protein